MHIKSLVVFIMLASLSYSVLQCGAGKNYVKVVMTTSIKAAEESYKILDGASVLASSPVFTDNSIKESEFCIAKSNGDLYTLKMMNSFSTSWSLSSYIEIIGENNNIVFKSYMIEASEENHTFSLFQPVADGSAWKFTSASTDSDWLLYGFDDSSWSTYIDGSMLSKVGTQYFRKQFTGNHGYIAFELGVKYRFGIIVYISNIEIYRNNLPSGTILSTTPSSDQYSSAIFRRVIIPKTAIIPTNNVLCIEIHPPSITTQQPVEFDAWLSLYHPSEDNGSCYVLPYKASITSSQGQSVDHMMNWDRMNGWTVNPITSPAIVTIDYSSLAIVAKVNAIRIYSGPDPTNMPHTLSLMGFNGDRNSTELRGRDLVFTPNKHQLIESPFSDGIYGKHVMTVEPTWSGVLSITELQLAVCVLTPPTVMELNTNTVHAHVNVEFIRVYPKSGVFTGCKISPYLPEGLTFNGDTCEVSGVITSLYPLTTYTLSSDRGHGFSSMFSLTVTECNDVTVAITYYNGVSAAYDYAFTVQETVGGAVLFAQSSKSLETLTSVTTRRICTAVDSITVTLSSARGFWSDGAFVQVSRVKESTFSDVLLDTGFDILHFGSVQTYTLSLAYAVKTGATWFYLFTSIPSDWYSTTTTGWKSAAVGSFGSAVTLTQLFKMSFVMSSLDGVTGLMLHVKYISGCVVYLNGIEVFRNRVVGPITSTSRATGSYESTVFRGVSLPLRTVAANGAMVNYLIKGSNTLAIALVSALTVVATVDFDASLRIIKGEEVRRSMALTATSGGLVAGTGESDAAAELFNSYYTSYAGARSCDTNFLEITFDMDRRETVTSLILWNRYDKSTEVPNKMIIKARTTSLDPWITLHEVDNMLWWDKGQRKKVVIPNSKPYNSYRIENIKTSSLTNCVWSLSYIELVLDPIALTSKPLLYPTKINAFEGINISEVYPSSQLFYSFSVVPPLPTGLLMDTVSGVIVGTPVAITTQNTYIVSAISLNGKKQSIAVVVEVQSCTGTSHLITSSFYLTSDYSSVSYTLYEGLTVGGKTVASGDSFTYGYQMLYSDFCLAEAIYTLQVNAAGGLTFPAGYMLSVDSTRMYFDLNTIPKGSSTGTSSLTFSSYLPFETGRTQWKIYRQGILVNGWNAIGASEKDWMTVAASAMGTMDATTVYVRHSFSIPSVQQYSVINVEVTYIGGIAAYFNGKLVARFNLRDSFSYFTKAIVATSITTSQFHVILMLNGGVNGNNVIAFEVHASPDGKTTDPLVFDAVGVFGVTACSPLVDSYTPQVGDASEGHDLDMSTFLAYPAHVTSLQYRVENLVGSKWNAFGLYVGDTITLSFTFYGRHILSDDWTVITSVVGKPFTLQERNVIMTPVGNAGYTYYRVQFDAVPVKPLILQSAIMYYCLRTDMSCAAVDGYDMAQNGEMAVVPCEYGFMGYSYRICTNGIWGSVITSKCVKRMPADLSYTSSAFIFVRDTHASTGVPDVSFIPTSFELSSGVLPAGMSLSTKTGEISGQPTAESSNLSVTVTARNSEGSTSGVVSMTVRVATCGETDLFLSSDLGVVVKVSCSKKGNYVGSVTGSCILGNDDGVWSKRGICIPQILLIVLIIITMVAVLLVILFLLIYKSSVLYRNQREYKKELEKKEGLSQNTIRVNGSYLSVTNPSNLNTSSVQEENVAVVTESADTQSQQVVSMTPVIRHDLGIVPGARRDRTEQSMGPVPPQPREIEMVSVGPTQMDSASRIDVMNNMTEMTMDTPVSLGTTVSRLPPTPSMVRRQLQTPVTPLRTTTPRNMVYASEMARSVAGVSSLTSPRGVIQRQSPTPRAAGQVLGTPRNGIQVVAPGTGSQGMETLHSVTARPSLAAARVSGQQYFSFNSIDSQNEMAPDRQNNASLRSNNQQNMINAGQIDSQRVISSHDGMSQGDMTPRGGFRHVMTPRGLVSGVATSQSVVIPAGAAMNPSGNLQVGIAPRAVGQRATTPRGTISRATTPRDFRTLNQHDGRSESSLGQVMSDSDSSRFSIVSTSLSHGMAIDTSSQYHSASGTPSGNRTPRTPGSQRMRIPLSSLDDSVNMQTSTQRSSDTSSALISTSTRVSSDSHLSRGSDY